MSEGVNRTIPDSTPEMIAPITLFEFGKFFLNEAGCSAFEVLHDFTHGTLRRVLNVHVDVVHADGTLENDDVLCVANLDQEFSAPLLNITFEDLVTIFCDPDKMHG